MENQRKYYELAKGEPPVKTDDLLAEIAPILTDYFVGEFTVKQTHIEYRLPNGQRFKISADEIR